MALVKIYFLKCLKLIDISPDTRKRHPDGRWKASLRKPRARRTWAQQLVLKGRRDRQQQPTPRARRHAHTRCTPFPEPTPIPVPPKRDVGLQGQIWVFQAPRGGRPHTERAQAALCPPQSGSPAGLGPMTAALSRAAREPQFPPAPCLR